MIANRELKLVISREIERIRVILDKKIASYQTKNDSRNKFRSNHFHLIELEESLGSSSEITVRSEISRINLSVDDKDLSIKISGYAKDSEKSLNFKLTRKEFQILNLLPKGLSIKEMASQLFLTESTIKTHLSAIYRKLGVANRVQAISVAKANNLLTF